MYLKGTTTTPKTTIIIALHVITINVYINFHWFFLLRSYFIFLLFCSIFCCFQKVIFLLCCWCWWCCILSLYFWSIICSNIVSARHLSLRVCVCVFLFRLHCFGFEINKYALCRWWWSSVEVAIRLIFSLVFIKQGKSSFHESAKQIFVFCILVLCIYKSIGETINDILKAHHFIGF